MQESAVVHEMGEPEVIEDSTVSEYLKGRTESSAKSVGIGLTLY